MKKFHSALLRVVAGATIIGLGVPAIAADYSANIEFDNTYRSDREVAGVTTLKRGLEQSGRVEFNASGKIGNDVFVAGKASFLAKKDGTAGVDDMWFQLGNKRFDVKLGRFEAFNLFPVPGDVLLDYAGTVYTASALRGRKGTSSAYGQGQFHAAGTFKATSALAFEVGVVEFQQTEDVAHVSPSTDAVKGIRPIVSFTAGAFSAAAGLELVKYSNDNSETGVGATVGYDFDFMKLNVNAAFGKDDTAAPGRSAHKQTTLGLTASSKLGLAGGLILAKNEADPGVEDGKVTTVYASYTHSLFDLKGATWSLGVNSSTVGGSYENTTTDEKGMRLRFNYTF